MFAVELSKTGDSRPGFNLVASRLMATCAGPSMRSRVALNLSSFSAKSALRNPSSSSSTRSRLLVVVLRVGARRAHHAHAPLTARACVAAHAAAAAWRVAVVLPRVGAPVTRRGLGARTAIIVVADPAAAYTHVEPPRTADGAVVDALEPRDHLARRQVLVLRRVRVGGLPAVRAPGRVRGGGGGALRRVRRRRGARWLLGARCRADDARRRAVAAEAPAGELVLGARVGTGAAPRPCVEALAVPAAETCVGVCRVRRAAAPDSSLRR